MDESNVNSVLDLLYNFITMMYTLPLFIYFANIYDRIVINTVAENCRDSLMQYMYLTRYSIFEVQFFV